MIGDIRGINKMKDAETDYRPFRTLCFINDKKAEIYNQRMKYDYVKESQRILKGMSKNG